MLEDTLMNIQVSEAQTLSGSEESTDFTLKEHYQERIEFHNKMLNYYLKESCGIGA